MGKAGEDMWQQYRQVASTTAMAYEFQEAVSQKREPDESIVTRLLASGADPCAMAHLGRALDWLSDDGFDSDDDEEEESEEESEPESAEESEEESERDPRGDDSSE